jgi:hypothetical protein
MSTLQKYRVIFPQKAPALNPTENNTRSSCVTTGYQAKSSEPMKPFAMIAAMRYAG